MDDAGQARDNDQDAYERKATSRLVMDALRAAIRRDEH